MPRPPRLPADRRRGELERVGFCGRSALLPDAATGSTSLKNAASSARAWLRVKPSPARLMLSTSAPLRIENSMPRTRSPTVKQPRAPSSHTSLGVDGHELRGSGHALASDAVAVERGDQARDEGPVSHGVGHVAAAGGGVERASHLAGELGVGHVEARVDHRHRAGRSAARRGERLRGAHGVVGPGELEALVVGVEHVERVLGRSQLAVTLDVGHAPVAAQGGHQRRAAGGRGCEHADRVNASGSAPRAAERRGHSREVGVVAHAHEHARAARGRARSAPARASGLRPTPPRASGQRQGDRPASRRTGRLAQQLSQCDTVDRVRRGMRGRCCQRARAEEYRERRSTH